MKTFHILNGDALADRFPSEIEGSKIICRECLCEGPVDNLNLEGFYQDRKHHLQTTFPQIDYLDYNSDVSSEFEKIKQIPAGSDVFLWFEQDVFCQVNLWFMLYLLREAGSSRSIYLVLTDDRSPYGFSGYSNQELLDLYRRRRQVDDLLPWTQLWNSYQQHQLSALTEIGEKLSEDFPFLPKTIRALIESIPTENSIGRPSRVLREIKNSLDEVSFGKVFRAFCKQEAIYGYGDLQVKRLYDQLNK
jgi:hypothetical protein